MAKTNYQWLLGGLDDKVSQGNPDRFTERVHTSEDGKELIASDGRELRWMPHPSTSAPDFNRVRKIIDDDMALATITVQPKALRGALKVAIEKGKLESDRYSRVKMEVNGKSLIGDIETGEVVDGSHLAAVWVDAVRLNKLIDITCPLITIYLRKPLDPVHIVQGELEALLMPVRGYDE